MAHWQPKKITPKQLRVITLWFNRMSNQDIATETGYTPQQVSNLINTEWAQEILGKLQEQTLDTIMDVQTEAQAVAPMIMQETIRLALHGVAEPTRTANCKTILEIAGHRPVTRIDMNAHMDARTKYDQMTDEELRAAAAAQVAGPTVH